MNVINVNPTAPSGQVFVSQGAGIAGAFSATPVLGVAASQPGTISLAKGVGGGALWTLASGATSAWTLTGMATAPAQGDLFTFSNAAGQMATIPDVAVGQVLISGGVSAAASFSANPTVTGMTLSGLTPGSVLYAGAGGLLSQDNANRFYDAANHRDWIGSAGAGSGWPVAASKLNVYSASDAQLTLVGDGLSAYASLYAYGTSKTPTLFARHAAGTMLTPTATQAGAAILRIGTAGYGTSWPGASKATIEVTATETVTGAGVGGTQMSFYGVLANGTNATGTNPYVNGTVEERLRIAPQPQILFFPNGQSAPAGYFIFQNQVNAAGVDYTQSVLNIVGLTGSGPTGNPGFTASNYWDDEIDFGVTDGTYSTRTILIGGEGNITFPGGTPTCTAYDFYIQDLIGVTGGVARYPIAFGSGSPNNVNFGSAVGVGAGYALWVSGHTNITDANGTASGATILSNFTKNDANAWTFPVTLIKPTLNFGASNAGSIVNVFQLDTVNTSLTGNTTNLLNVSYGGAQRLLLGSGGNLMIYTEAAASTTLTTFNNGAAGATFKLSKARGTYAAPRRTDLADALGSFTAFGWTAVDDATLAVESATFSGALKFIATDAFTAGATLGCKLTIATTTAGTGAGSTVRLTIDENGLTLAAGHNLVTDTATGMKIGTATTQKIGLFNATPIVQPTRGATLTNSMVSHGTSETCPDWTSLATYATDAQSIHDACYWMAHAINQHDVALRALGLLS